MPITSSASGVKAGTVAFFAANTTPPGWLKANGATISRAAYAALFAAIGTTYGAGDGVTTFKLPDCRGEFLRGLDDGRGVDAERTIGSSQSHAIRQSSVAEIARGSPSVTSQSGDATFTEVSNAGYSIGTQGGRGTLTIGTATETRPRNVAMLACIKY